MLIWIFGDKIMQWFFSTKGNYSIVGVVTKVENRCMSILHVDNNA